MKWNAIISKVQYEKTLQRLGEIADALPGSKEEDELILLRMLIRDYEERNSADSFGSPSFPGTKRMWGGTFTM